MINLIIGVFSIAAAVLWFRSTFDVLSGGDDATEEWDIIYEKNGKEYSVNRTMKMQSRLNKWAAVCASIAALMQGYSALTDFVNF